MFSPDESRKLAQAINNPLLTFAQRERLRSVLAAEDDKPTSSISNLPQPVRNELSLP